MRHLIWHEHSLFGQLVKKKTIGSYVKARPSLLFLALSHTWMPHIRSWRWVELSWTSSTMGCWRYLRIIIWSWVPPIGAIQPNTHTNRIQMCANHLFSTENARARLIYFHFASWPLCSLCESYATSFAPFAEWIHGSATYRKWPIGPSMFVL